MMGRLPLDTLPPPLELPEGDDSARWRAVSNVIRDLQERAKEIVDRIKAIEEDVMPVCYELLAQGSPSGATAELMYSPSDGKKCAEFRVLVSNHSGAARIIQLFQDEDGIDFGDATRIASNVALADDVVLEFAGIAGVAAGGALGIQSDNTSVTFTVYGREAPVA